MHDQHFKTLLRRFFGDFVRIVLPDLAPRLRLERARFLDKECLRRIARVEIDDAGRFLLGNTVETYIELDSEAREEYARLLAKEPSKKVQIMEMTWADRIEARGKIMGMQSLLLGQLERRFGPLAPATREKVQELDSADELTRLADRLLEARSVEDLGL